MDWSERMVQYLFYFSQTTYRTLDLEENLEEFISYTSWFNDIDLEEWIVDNDLEKEYKEYMDRAGFIE